MPGFFNLTVCLDAETAADNIRKGQYWNGAPCEDPQDATITAPQTSDGWTPGTCGLHITQWKSLSQMGDGDQKPDDNPLDVMQLEIAIQDDVGQLMGYAPKQPFAGTLNLTSKLPYELLASSPDENTVEIWYSDQHFTSDDSNCNFGDYWGDGEDRQGDCTFLCPMPSSDPPASATESFAPPDPIEAAYYGDGPNTNPASGPSATTYNDSNDNGGCGLHIRQYQMNEGSTNGYSNPNPYYALELTLYDADGTFIGYQSMSYPSNGVVTVQGVLPYQLIATSGTDDSQPLSLAYAGSTWDSESDGCGGMSDFNFGFRDGDCSFDYSKGI